MTDTSQLVDESGRNSLDPKNAPVALPPGSFDIDELQKGLDRAVKAKPEERDEAINKALEASAGEGTDLTRRDPATQEGYRFVEVENEELGVTERIQVFDAELAEKAQDAKDAAAEKAVAKATPETKPAATRGTGATE